MKMENHEMKKSTHVCPAEHMPSLDNGLRRLIHNPNKLFGPYLKKGMRVIDLGCGSGTFTRAMAAMVGSEGHVMAIDLQPKALKMLEDKDMPHLIRNVISTYACAENDIGLHGKTDFALAFYMAHEVPDQASFYTQVGENLHVGGKLFIAEPIFHVKKKQFEKQLILALEAGLEVIGRPKVRFSHAAVCEKKQGTRIDRKHSATTTKP